MNSFIARANIDHYLEMLKGGDIPPDKKSSVIKLLIEEEGKLGHDREQLEFAENRATVCRERVIRQRRLRDCFDPGSTDWAQAERLLVNFESLSQAVEGFCKRLRKQVSANSL